MAVSLGQLVEFQGQGLSCSCRPVPNVLLDLWQACEHGKYDNSGFRSRAHIFSDESGNDRFRSGFPGLYEARPRPFHVKPANLAPLYTKVMAHPAHHRQMNVPVYALPEAQAELNETFGKQIEYLLTPGQYRRIYRACKLFDFDRMCWTDFHGVPTS